MDFQIGDVVMFMGHGYIVIDFNRWYFNYK